MRHLLLLIFLFPLSVASQNADSLLRIEDDLFLMRIDSLLSASYAEYFGFEMDSTSSQDYYPDSIKSISKEEIQSKMEELNAQTPFDLRYNSQVARFIELYGNKRRKTMARVMGSAQFYFPLFEQQLSAYDMPLELKYLAVVESALNPKARSRAGAVGLWQFMYSTGKVYGLDISSYRDERMDPIQSTDAACRYLSKLYRMYDDWNLALAAYNSGPGNVNKAIRRAGGKRDYWSIRPYLPRETRSYVPAFIAVAYVMNHSADYGLEADPAKFHYFQCDTLHIHQNLKFDQIIAFTDSDLEELQFLNPSYKRNFIPGPNDVLRLSHRDIGLFLQNEDSIYNYLKEEEQLYEEEETLIVYTVKSGDVLGVIADKHNISISSLKSWNNLRGNTIYPGQKLNIYIDKRSSFIPLKPESKSRFNLLQNYCAHRPLVEKEIFQV